jgi:competence protein ComEC
MELQGLICWESFGTPFFVWYNMLMHKSEIFLVLALSFLAGIFWGSFFQNFNQFFIYILLILAVIAAAIFYGNKIFLIIFFSLVTFFWGFHLVGAKLENINRQNLEGKEISEKVVVAKEPEIKDKYQNVVVKTKENLKILLNVNLYESLNYGDELDLKCQLKIPENKNEEFDYKIYLAKEGIFYLCQGAKIEKTGKNKGNKIYFAILSFKKRLENNISAVIPEPESALGKGLIFGGSSQLSKSQADNFSRTGLSHIVAVSGFNVTIIASILMAIGIFLGLWRKQAFWFAIVGIFLFVLSIGFPSSAVRAGVMGSLLLWAMKNGRLANSKNAIIFSASIMLLINPLLLRWDIGFQLSFLATLGIIELSPFWEKYLRKKHKSFGILENVFLTLSASIFVLPIIIYNFQTLSVISLISNALVLPVVPLAMLLVFLTSICGLFLQSFSLPLAWVTFLPLKYIIEVVNYLGSLKWASVEINNFGVGWVILWYIILFLTVYFAERKFKKFT